MGKRKPTLWIAQQRADNGTWLDCFSQPEWTNKQDVAIWLQENGKKGAYRIIQVKGMVEIVERPVQLQLKETPLVDTVEQDL
jgi:hypothetical protein